MLFTFPSRYLFTIGRLRYLALESGLPSFPQGFTCLVVLRIPAHTSQSFLTGLSPSLVTLSNVLESSDRVLRWSYNPRRWSPSPWFGLLPFRSPLLRESRLISFRRATEMFQFTRCPPSLQTSVHRRSPDITLEGLPHSESQGSQLACSSP